MHAFFRAPHLISTRINAIKCCGRCRLHLWCGCKRIARHDLYVTRRLLSINSPSIQVLVRQEYSSKLHSGLSRDWYQDAFSVRYFSTSSIKFDKEPLKPSSKVEVTVQELKKKKEDVLTEVVPAVQKKPLRQKIVDELVHYYHGFRLLFIDIKISAGLVWRLLNGKSLSRREHRLLIRTTGDLFRLVPFSVFIIVPFMELLLPFFIKFFPGMLPSTFQTATEKEDKIKQNLKVKLEMAKFLQQTLDEMAVQHKDHNSELAKQFSEWFQKVRTSGEYVSNEEIMKFSKLFEDEITLDSLSRSQLVALCRLLEVQTLGTNNLLRFQLRMKLRSLAADDKMIQKEGADTLSLAEVQQACRARGMRAYGVSEERLRKQLKQWLDLSLNEKVPASLLLLSRALMLPEAIPTSDKLKATISSLPETLLTQTKAAIGEKEGKIDNKVMLEVLKEEVRKMKEERKEQREERKKQEQEEEKKKEWKEEVVDKAPIVSLHATPELKDPAVVTATKVAPVVVGATKEQHIISKDLQALEDALDEISKEKKFIVEKGEIEELKEQMADYQEDVQDLQKAVAEQPKPEVQETKAAQRLFKRVNKMIGKMDKLLSNLESKEKQLKHDLQQKDLALETTDKKKEELLKIDDIMAAIKKIKDVPDQSRLQQIKNVLGKIDDDRDGSIKVEDVLKVIEFIGKENVHLTAKQLDELIELIDKEEILEVEDRIEKALQKEKETKLAEKQGQSKPGQSGQKPEPPASSGDLAKTPAPPAPKKIEKEQAVSAQPPPKPKMEAQQLVPPPPVTSIDSRKSKDNSKIL